MPIPPHGSDRFCRLFCLSLQTQVWAVDSSPTPVHTCLTTVRLFCPALQTQVWAVDSVPSRLELARSLGATEALDFTQTDVPAHIRQATGGVGADVALEVRLGGWGAEAAAPQQQQQHPQHVGWACQREAAYAASAAWAPAAAPALLAECRRRALRLAGGGRRAGAAPGL